MTECGNWRGITLTSIIAKLFSLILLDRIQKPLDNTLRDEQAGFRCGRGCRDQIFVLRHIIQQSVEFRRPLVMAFVDFEKAFDSVNRDVLWKVLRHYGLPQKYVDLICALHCGTKCQVLVNKTLTDSFEVNSGVLQGGVMSPLLFACLIDYILKVTVQDKRRGIPWVDGKYLIDLDYADDIVIFAETIEDLQSILNDLDDNAKKAGIKINIKKTKIMITEDAVPGQVMLHNKVIEEVNEFRYLGTIVARNGSMEAEFNERMRKANQAMGMLSAVWKSHRLSVHSKVRLYITLVRSILLYGHESWYSNESVCSRFVRFENKILRRILEVRLVDRIRVSHMRDVTQVPWIDDVIKRARWSWMGHVMRRDEEERLIKQAVLWRPEGTRRRGRPKPTWLNTMKKDAGERWNIVEGEAQDRQRWMIFMEALCVTRHVGP